MVVMNFAIFTELYSPSVGGQEIRFAQMAATLVKKGHSVAVYCICHDPSLPRTEMIDGVVVHRNPVAPQYTTSRIPGMPRQPITMLRYALWCRSMVKRHSTGLLIYNQWPLLHLALAPAKSRSRSLLDWCEVRTGFLFGMFQRYLPRMAYRNMAVSPAVQKHIAAVSGRPVEYIPSGIHCETYRRSAAKDRDFILYLGRIAKHKDLGFLVTAFEALKQRGYPGKLVVAGGGPWMTQLEERVAASNAKDDISILGRVDDEAKVDLLSRAEVLAITSRREGFPRVVSEAMASGLPVATMDYLENGTASVVRHYGCGEVAECRTESFVAAIEAIRASWERYSNDAMVRASELDWSELIGKIEDIAFSLDSTGK